MEYSHTGRTRGLDKERKEVALVECQETEEEGNGGVQCKGKDQLRKTAQQEAKERYHARETRSKVGGKDKRSRSKG